jgi:rRNA processing protein Gar1
MGTIKIRLKKRVQNIKQATKDILYIRVQKKGRKKLKYFFIIKPTRCTNFPNLLRHETLYVSGSSSAHHQEFIHSTHKLSIHPLKLPKFLYNKTNQMHQFPKFNPA